MTETENNDWETKVDSLLATKLSKQDKTLLARSLCGEPLEVESEIAAIQIQTHLDEIGLQSAPESLRNALYAIPDQNKKLANPLFTSRKLAALGAVATVLITVLLILDLPVGPTSPQPSATEIAQAQADLQTTLHYLRKATAISQQQIDKTVGRSMQTAIDSSLEPLELPVTKL